MTDAPAGPPPWTPPDGWTPLDGWPAPAGSPPPVASPPPAAWGAPGSAPPAPAQYVHPYSYGVPPVGPPADLIPLAPSFGSRRWWACLAGVVAIVAMIAFVVVTTDPSAPAVGVSPEGADPGSLSPSEPIALPEDSRPHRPVRMCTSVGPVEVTMPSLAGLEGPRSLRNIPQPAIGTFATAYADSRSYRYDVVVIEGVRDLYPSEEVALPAIVSNLDGDPSSVTTTATSPFQDQGLGLRFTEHYDGRTLVGTAVTSNGLVVILSVGVPDAARTNDTDFEANDRLGTLERSLVLPGPSGAAAASCVPTTLGGG